ncbi:MAG TPA: phosphate/phosphite/phosphonate ABC transporter substrate-binding protein [Thiobacillaceae bacterium]|nr:phosphate/phosphite/phosphonate ABC transporter substrate-binding protein [Thiobacillaceae bacterium]HNU65208.1 phosphate/phosphite/phosphonate ABC transporter substrate-binding protein [Thiobacillaceae bacterium]
MSIAPRVRVRRACLGLALALLSCVLATPARAARDLLFAVNEGTSSASDALFRRDKYADLAAYLSSAVHRPVKIETSNILPILVRNVQRQRYDVLLVRPSHIAARAMRDQGYRLLVAARGESRVHFIVRRDSPLKSLQDLHGRFTVFPDSLAYPTALGLAILRDAGIDPRAERVQYMNRQEAVGYAVRQGLADAGVVISYSRVGRDWEKNGGRLLYTRGKLPYWSIIVSPRVDAAVADQLRAAFLALDKTSRGKAILGQIGIDGFEPGSQQAYLDMLTWVEGRRP